MNVMKVQLFGTFSVYYGTRTVIFRKVTSAKTVRLLQILLLAGENGINKTELTDGLYGWDENASAIGRNKNLNKLIYRLRDNLISNGLPKEEYVVIRDRMCYWKSSFPVQMDTREFEENIQKAKESRGKEKMNLLQSACDLYAGELLPMNLSDIWFLDKSNYFKQLYNTAVNELAGLYQSSGDYKKLIDLYNRVIMIYPFDGWQAGLVRCYLEHDYHEKALQLYRDTMDLYAREMGKPPTEEMEKCFEKLNVQDDNRLIKGKGVWNWKDSKRVNIWGWNLIQTIHDDKKERGACYCTYPSFVDFCRLVIRLQECYPFTGAIMFLTLMRNEIKGEDDTEGQQLQMNILRQAVRVSLRRGDAYTQYGNHHYILLLTNTEEEHCSNAFRRIESCFAQMGSNKYELWYQVIEITEL